MVMNVHTRDLKTSLSEASVLIDSLAPDRDILWPVDRWTAMRFDRPLGPGASGGHGIIRYFVEEYIPGRLVRFRFTEPWGFNGTHAFDIEETGKRAVRIRHVIDMKLSGAACFWWPVVIRWLHDALIEDAFDRAEAYAVGRPVILRKWSPWVRFLRYLFKPRKRR